MKLYSIQPRIMVSWLDSRSPPSSSQSVSPRPPIPPHTHPKRGENWSSTSCRSCHSKRSTSPLFPGFSTTEGVERRGGQSANCSRQPEHHVLFCWAASTQKGNSDKPLSLSFLHNEDKFIWLVGHCVGLSPSLSLFFLLTFSLPLPKSISHLSSPYFIACMLSCLSCPALCDPMDCSPTGSSHCGILQARILEWVAVLSSRGSSWPRDWTHISRVSCIGRQVLQPPRKAHLFYCTQ